MFVIKAFFLICIFLNLTCINEGAKILGIFPNSGYSQYILGSALMKELAIKGHEVAMISAYSQNNPVKNLREISTKTENAGRSDSDNLFELDTLGILDSIKRFYGKVGLTLTQTVLSHPNVQKLLHSEECFDLVISELFVNEAHMGFAYHYKTPLILFSSIGASEWSNHLVGNPAPFSHHSLTFSGYSDHMDFWQRLKNSAFSVLDMVYKHFFVFPKQNEILKKYFPGAPDLDKLMYNASLILLNSNIAVQAPIAHVPNMIEIGGFHVSSKALPNDIQEFLDNARDGAIFFGMGSNLRTTNLPKETIDGILRAFSKLKQRVLWKWEDENLQGKPDNFKIGKWLPQQDILAHPNIRAFITHGGLLSLTESIYSGIPMVITPIFSDQKMNAEQAILNGVAVKVAFQDFTGDNLANALNEILTNSSYKEAALKRSKIFRDQPLKPMDKAIFWIEYVLRHQGSTHLRSAALNLTWYLYFLLDVIAFVIAVIGIIIYCCRLLFYYTFYRNMKQKLKVKNQ